MAWPTIIHGPEYVVSREEYEEMKRRVNMVDLTELLQQDLDGIVPQSLRKNS